jgi:hypothetical protein
MNPMDNSKYVFEVLIALAGIGILASVYFIIRLIIWITTNIRIELI